MLFGNLVGLCARFSPSRTEYQCTYALSDTSKFQPKTFDIINSDLKFILNKEEKTENCLARLVGKAVISDADFAKMARCGSSPGILYGLCKVHKGIPTGGNCPCFCPILSAIGTVSYNLAKFLVPILEPITTKCFVYKDSFSFATEVRNQNPDLYIGRYVHDTFLLFSSESHVKKLYRYLNTRHDNISFTYECETDDPLAFLDVLVSREVSQLVTSLYRKHTFSGLYTNFNSFIAGKYKTGLLLILIISTEIVLVREP